MATNRFGSPTYSSSHRGRSGHRSQGRGGGGRSRLLNPLTIILLVSAGLFFLFLIVSGLFLMKDSGDGWQGSKEAAIFNPGKAAVGVVEIKGVILDSKKILKTLERYEERSHVKAVVIRMNSPGGAVAPSQEIYEALKKYPKPVVVSMGSVAASGAFYIAMGATKVFANAGTITGSIGVIMEFVNLKKLYEWAKIKRFSLTTGRYKGTGTPYRDMSEDERRLLQGMIDSVLNQFKQAVSDGRKIEMDRVTRIADGRIMNGEQAKKLHLVDEIGTIQSAIEEAAKLGQIKGKPKVIYPRKLRRLDWFEYLLDQRDEESARSEVLQTLFEGAFRKPGLYMIWKPAW